METIIKKYGNSNIIILSPEYLKINKLKVGDPVNVEIKKLAKVGRK